MPSRPLTVVTGGGRGTGAATALHLAGLGHDVVVGCRDDGGAAGRVVLAARAAGVTVIRVGGDL